MKKLTVIANRSMTLSIIYGATFMGLMALHKAAPSTDIEIFGLSPEDATQHPIYLVVMIIVTAVFGAAVLTFLFPPKNTN
jgi:hypothetical protein